MDVSVLPRPTEFLDRNQLRKKVRQRVSDSLSGKETRMRDPVTIAALGIGLGESELAVVRDLTLFRTVSDSEMIELIKTMHVRDYGRDQLLFTQGDPADRIFVVLDGWVRLFRSTEDGGEVTINLFSSGEILAEAAPFLGNAYPVSGITAQDTRLLVVSATKLLSYLERNPKVCFGMMASMAMKLQGFLRQVEQLSSRSATERLASFILSLAGGTQGSCTVRLPVEKRLIASRLGMQPESFSRALSRLKREGVIASGNTLQIDDCKRLQALVRSGAGIEAQFLLRGVDP